MSGASSDGVGEGDAVLGNSETLRPTGAGDTPLGEREIGNYRLIEVIGEGGMGEVYKAEQRGAIRRIVALKVIKLGLDTKSVIARFEAERQALALMNHQNIARVFDGGSTTLGRPYFVMEYVPGEPINAWCDKHKLPIRARLELFAKVCEAIQHAHTKGIIHRDLKASNVLVTEIDGKPVPKIIDFGVAKAINQRLTEQTLFTETGRLVGTPAYTSPEQAEGGADVDTRSDVYSLGVLLYELLTGALPFDPTKLRAMAYGEMQRIIREVDPPRPSTFYSHPTASSRDAAQRRAATVEELAITLRHELEWIPLLAMRKERSERYQTAADLARDIGSYLAGTPLIAAPNSRIYRWRKAVRRNKGLVAAAAAVALALLLGLVMTSWQARRAERQKDLADKSALEARKRLAHSEASARLFSEIFRGIRPSVVQGKDTELLIDVLRAAEPKIDEILTEPAWRADHLILLGDAFRQLGDLDHARELLQRASELAQESYDQAKASGQFEYDFKEVRTLVAALDRSGELNNDLHKFKDAEALWRKALHLSRAHLADSEPIVVHLLANIGTALRYQGKHDEAVPFHEDAMRLANADPQKHPASDRAILASNLGALRVGQGQLDQAHDAFEMAETLFAEAGDSSSSGYAVLLGNQAALAHQRQQLEEALRLINRVIDVRRTTAKKVDPLAQSDDLRRRSRILTDLKQHSAAAEDLLAAMRLLQGDVQDASLRTLDTLARESEQAGVLLQEAARPADARKVLNQSLEYYDQALNAAELQAGRASTQPAAFAAYSAVMADYKERRWATHQRLAQIILAMGETDEALRMIRECLARQQELYGDNPGTYALWMLATSQWILAEALLAQDPLAAQAEALQLLAEANKRLIDAQAPTTPTMGGRPSVRENVLRRLIALSESRGDAAGAQRLRDELSALGH